MTIVFDWIVVLIVIQTVLALLALAWALYSGQLGNLEQKGRRIFFEDMKSDGENDDREIE